MMLSELVYKFTVTEQKIDFVLEVTSEKYDCFTSFPNILPIFSRMPDRRGGHPPAGKPSGPEWAGLPGPPVRGCQSVRPPQQTGQALPGSGLHAG